MEGKMNEVVPVQGAGSIKVRVFEIQVVDSIIPEKALKEIKAIFDRQREDLWHMNFRPLPVLYKAEPREGEIKRHDCKIRVKEEWKEDVIQLLIRYAISYQVLGYWEWHNEEIKQ